MLCDTSAQSGVRMTASHVRAQVVPQTADAGSSVCLLFHFGTFVAVNEYCVFFCADASELIHCSRGRRFTIVCFMSSSFSEHDRCSSSGSERSENRNQNVDNTRCVSCRKLCRASLNAFVVVVGFRFLFVVLRRLTTNITTTNVFLLLDYDAPRKAGLQSQHHWATIRRFRNALRPFRLSSLFTQSLFLAPFSTDVDESINQSINQSINHATGHGARPADASRTHWYVADSVRCRLVAIQLAPSQPEFAFAINATFRSANLRRRRRS